jgi:hypothetical protein
VYSIAIYIERNEGWRLASRWKYDYATSHAIFALQSHSYITSRSLIHEFSSPGRVTNQSFCIDEASKLRVYRPAGACHRICMFSDRH